MKHAALHSIAHNIADSLGSGCSLLTGVFEFDLFDEVGIANSEIRVDFLAGIVHADNPSLDLLKAGNRTPAVLAELCERQGGNVDDFREASARFWRDDIGKRFNVTVQDSRGRQSTIEYRGWPGKRLHIIDPLGRRRPKPAINQVRP